jgi:hypothetical protein
MIKIRGEKPLQLHTLNAIRVIAEFVIVRFHIIHDLRPAGPLSGNGPVGIDIMCFFFVLSGFVMMYTSMQVDYSTWASKQNFILRRLKHVYPVFLFCWLLSFPVLVSDWYTGSRDCWSRQLCTIIQLGMLDSWLGCGVRTVMGISWYLSCVIWLWVAFPFMKDKIADFFFIGENIWIKMGIINVVWGFAFYVLWGFDIYTLSVMPLLRLGEFLIGCGAACALRFGEPYLLINGRYWILLLSVITLYAVERTGHGMDFLCLNEKAENSECTLWLYGQKWLPAKSPCILVIDKIINKFALVYAAVIHGLARTELNGGIGGGCVTWVLNADIFKFISKFSLMLYLSHLNVSCALRWIGKTVFGWSEDEWHADILLFLVYYFAYVQHCFIGVVHKCICSSEEKVTTIEEGKDLLIQENMSS